MSADARFEELARALEPELKKQVDAYGVALMMIRGGAADPKKVATDVLAKWGHAVTNGELCHNRGTKDGRHYR